MNKPAHEKQFLDLRASCEEAKRQQQFPAVMVTVKELEELLAALDEARRDASKWPTESHLDG